MGIRAPQNRHGSDELCPFRNYGLWVRGGQVALVILVIKSALPNWAIIEDVIDTPVPRLEGVVLVALGSPVTLNTTVLGLLLPVLRQFPCVILPLGNQIPSGLRHESSCEPRSGPPAGGTPGRRPRRWSYVVLKCPSGEHPAAFIFP